MVSTGVLTHVKGPTGTSDNKAEYIWLMPEVGATGPTSVDDGLGGHMPLVTAVGQAGTLHWLHTHDHGTPILTNNLIGAVVPFPATYKRPLSPTKPPKPDLPLSASPPH